MTEWRPSDIPVEVPDQDGGGYSGPTDYEIPDEAITEEVTDNDDVNAAAAAEAEAADNLMDVAIGAPDDWTAYEGDAPRAENKTGKTADNNGSKPNDGTDQRPSADGTEQRAAPDGTEQTANNRSGAEDSDPTRDATSGADGTGDRPAGGKHSSDETNADETRQEPDSTGTDTGDSGNGGRHRADQQAQADTQTADTRISPVLVRTLLEAFEPEPEARDAEAKDVDKPKNPEDDMTLDEAGADSKTDGGSKPAGETEPEPAAEATPPEDTTSTNTQAETEDAADTASQQQAEAEAAAANEAEQARHRAAEPEVEAPAPEPARPEPAAEPEPAATEQPEPEPAPAPPAEAQTEAASDNASTETEDTADDKPAPQRWHEGVDLDAAASGGTSAGGGDSGETDASGGTAETARTTAEEGSDRGAEYLGTTATSGTVAPTEGGDGAVSGEVVGNADSSAESSSGTGGPLEGMTSFVGEAFADVQGAAATSPNTSSSDPNANFVPTAGNPTENYPGGLPSPEGGVPMPPRPPLEDMTGGSPLPGEGGGDESGESTGGGSDAYSGPALHENPDRQPGAAARDQQQQQQAASTPHPEAQAQTLGDVRENIRPQNKATQIAKTVGGAVVRGTAKGVAGTVVTGAASAVAAVGMLGTHIGKNAVKQVGLGTYSVTVKSNGMTRTIEVHAPNAFSAKLIARFKASFLSH